MNKFKFVYKLERVKRKNIHPHKFVYPVLPAALQLELEPKPKSPRRQLSPQRRHLLCNTQIWSLFVNYTCLRSRIRPLCSFRTDRDVLWRC